MTFLVGQVCWRGHQGACERWWSHLTDLCDPTGNLEVAGCVLPEVCGRGVQEGAKGYSDTV